MDYPYRLGEEATNRGVAVTKVLSADAMHVFGTMRRHVKTGAITAVSASGGTLGHYKSKMDAAKVIAQWGMENVEGRQNG